MSFVRLTGPFELPKRDAPPPPAPSGLHSVALWVFAICGALIAFGVWGVWPWLVEEHRRLEPWKIVGIWIGDAVALACFVWWGVSVFLFGHQALPERAVVRNRRLTLLTLIGGLLLDLGFTTTIHHLDQVGYDHGLTTVAQVQSVRKADAPYILTCTYADATGKPWQAQLRVYEGQGSVPPELLGVGRKIELRTRPRPFPIRVRYDPSWPRRCWVEGRGIADASDLHKFSLITLILQGLMIPMVWEIGRNPEVRQRAGVLAHTQLHDVVPLAIEACLLAFFGVLSGLGRLGLGP